MKTATMPALRVDPALRQAAEDVLQAGETLSSFVEQSVRANIERRRQQQAFIARGLAARDEARQNSDYLAASDVLQELDDMLADAERKTAR